VMAGPDAGALRGALPDMQGLSRHQANRLK
jgi:hypothetical protein